MSSYFNTQSHIDILWSMGYTGKNIKVGIVDTGIKTEEYSNIKNKIVCGHNFSLDGSGRRNIMSECLHGYTVASLVLSTSPEAKLVIAKVLNDNGIGDPKKTAKGIRYCISKKCDIINCSIAGGPDEDLEKAINEARKHNIIVVSSTGNNGKEMFLYPASYINCISVGAMTKDYKLTSFSNYNVFMDVLALGEDIHISTSQGEIIDGGTSLSSPFVSGTLALLKQKLIKEQGKKPTWLDLYFELMSNCSIIEGLEKEKQGNGYINIKEG